jgi:hypothetical protein
MDTRIADTANPPPDGPGPNGEAAAVADWREENRQARGARLDEMDEMILIAARQLTGYICGKVSVEDAPALAGIADPCLTLTRLARAQRQVIAYQEKLEDDAETRARRLADEDAQYEAEFLKAEAEQDAALKAGRIEANKRQIRQAFKEASFEIGPGPGLPRPERERLLDDLMSDYERFDDLDRELGEVVKDLGREFELMVGRPRPAPDPAMVGLEQLVLEMEKLLLGIVAELDPKLIAKAGPAPAKAKPPAYQRPPNGWWPRKPP